MLLQHTEQARAVLDCLKMLGVGLAIDDFGTGYSSLSYLQQLPLDILKIDRSFVERMESDAGGEGLARAVIGLAPTLSLRTVAEGIEQPDAGRAACCARLRSRPGISSTARRFPPISSKPTRRRRISTARAS